MLAPWPSTIETLADVTALEGASRIEKTPCGKGSIVWHVWGDGNPEGVKPHGHEAAGCPVRLKG